MAGKVLIVDDVSTNRLVLKAKLSRSCYETLQAGDGATALALARVEQPGLILLDMMLPDLDGVEVCRRLRADPATRDIPVIVVTALDDAESRRRALRAGADDFLTKPVDELMLLARMRNLLRARQTENELGQRIPAVTASGFAEPEAAFEGAGPRGRIALVARDRAAGVAWRAALARHLQHDFEIFSPSEALNARDGDDAPQLFVIDADIDRPGGGLQLMSELRARAGTRHAALCVVLDPAARDTGITALDQGASELLPRDFEPREAALRIATQLRRKLRADRLRDALRDELRFAVTDPLTGLHNRRHAIPQLARIAQQARRTGQRYAIMLLDLDRFKEVNDRWGHGAGDAVLMEVATRMRDAMRPSDMLARIGGEEFLVAMPGVDLGAARLAAERLRHVVEARPFALPGDAGSVAVTLSVGLVIEDGSDGQDGIGGIDRADRALRAAKSEGRNQVTVGLSAA